MSAESYDIAALHTELAGSLHAGNLHYFAKTDSTNSLAIAAAQAGAPTGSVFIADMQTAGRGRGAHQWHSPAGLGLYLSVLYRPQLAASRALLLSLATGLAAQSAIRRSAGISIDIRWPNDLMIAEKKCGGILVETSVEPSGQLRHAVIGIGINVRHTHLPEELATIATSLHLANGGDYDRQKLLVALLKSLDDEVRLLESAHSAEALLERFEAASTWVRGKRVRVEEAGGYTGITAGLSPQGFLLVQTDEGPRTVLSGGVRAL